MNQQPTDDGHWLEVIARSLAFMCLHTADLRDNDSGRANQPGRSGRGRQSGVVFRPRLRAAMIARPVRPRTFSARMHERMQNHLPSNTVALAEVDYLEDSTVVLRGVALTEYDRLVAANLAALEPGVVRVRNELGVGPLPVVDDAPAEFLPPPRP